MPQGPFDALMAELDPPMVVVTTAVDGERSGCLVGFSTQCSIEPPRYMVFLSDKNHTFGLARRAEHLAVHLLGAHQVALAERFGAETGDEVDKFAGCRWSPGPGGVPLLDDVDAWFVGRVLARVPVGDHVGHLLEPIRTERRRPVHQLGFQAARHIDPGHDP